MIKTVLVGLVTFFFISSLVIFIGHVFNIDLFIFTLYESSSTAFVAEGSIIPFVIGLVFSYFVGNYYQRRKQGSAEQ